MFTLECLNCTKETITRINRVDEDGSVCPECGDPMYLAYTTAHYGIADGDYHFTSQSLAINPSQMEEHKAVFPGVGVLPDGQIQFTSVKQHSDYLKKSGFVKQTKKIRELGKTK